MAIIDDVKCPRCDRKYSGVRSRCPYCGARRMGFGKYSKDNENAKGKMLVSVLILAVFTVAAGILLFSTPVVAEEEPTLSPSILPEDAVNSLEGLSTPTPSPTPVETPPPPPVVETVAVKHTDGSVLLFGYDITLKIGQTLDLAVFIDPPGVEVEPRIASENEEHFTVEWVVGGVKNGFRITAHAATKATNLIVSAGDISFPIIIRIS